MDMGHRQAARDGALRLRICWVLGALWLGTFLGALLLAGSGIGAALGGVQSLLLITILLVHGSLLYGWAGLGAYLAIGIAVGFACEASSVANGFPFGSYVHHAPGPKPLGVPIPAILAYVGVGWYAWTVGRVLMLERPDRMTGLARFTTPVIAGLVIAGFDYPYDPIGATIQKAWTYTYPSGQFGVPLTNYLGWAFTGWLLFQIFALIEHRFRPARAATTRGYWLLPCLIWLVMAAQFLILWLKAPAGTTSVGARTFIIADIYEAALAGSLFTLLMVGLIGVIRLAQSTAFAASRQD